MVLPGYFLDVTLLVFNLFVILYKKYPVIDIIYTKNYI